MNPVILTMPHGGTHFAMTVFDDVLGLDPRWAHFEPNAVPRIYRAMDDPAVRFFYVRRPDELVAKSWEDRDRPREGFGRCLAIRNFMLCQIGHERLWLLDINSPKQFASTCREFMRELGRPIPLEFEQMMREWPVLRTKRLLAKKQL